MSQNTQRMQLINSSELPSHINITESEKWIFGYHSPIHTNHGLSSFWMAFGHLPFVFRGKKYCVEMNMKQGNGEHVSVCSDWNYILLHSINFNSNMLYILYILLFAIIYATLAVLQAQTIPAYMHLRHCPESYVCPIFLYVFVCVLWLDVKSVIRQLCSYC